MTKKSLSPTSAAVFCFIVFLFVPVKIIQCIMLSVVIGVILSRLYSAVLKRSLAVSRPVTFLRAACGDTFTLSFTVTNNSRLPAFVCYVHDNQGSLSLANGQNRFLFTLRPHEMRSVSYTVFGTSRGIYRIGPVIVSASDPLGIFPFSVSFDAECKVLMHPAEIRYPIVLDSGIPQGSMSIQNICYEDVTMRRSLREYRSGDELKRINWRASAKYGNLFTNEYQNTFDCPVFVFLNLALDDYPLEQRYDKGEKAIKIAAEIVRNAEMLHQKCGFASYAKDFPYLPPASNQAGCILDILATIQMEKGSLTYNPMETLKLRLPDRTRIFIVGPDTVQEAEKTL